MWKNVPVAVNAIIVRNKKVLLGKRSRNPSKGTWSLIGGFVEPGESLETALAREIMEEINCVLTESVYFGSLPETYNGRLVLLPFFVCKIKGKPELKEEHTELIWTPKLIYPIAFPAEKTFLQKFFSG